MQGSSCEVLPITMCGIAGLIDLAGRRPVSAGVAECMTRALTHRGPDEEGYLQRPGIALGSRRLSIVGLADGQQPVNNEDRNVFVVFNGELFDHVERRAELEAHGHKLVKSCDTEIIPHMWEEYGEGMWEKLRGQFAIALWDERKRELQLGRDRFGIAPLYWTRQGDWLLFSSEIKGLLASGMVPRVPDRRGIDHIFSFSALPGPITCFEGVNCLPPGHFLRITLGREGESATITERAYWEMDFPDAGDEVNGDEGKIVQELEDVLMQAVEERLRADVPVGAYLSGGVDSSMIVALSCHLKGPAINTYTVRVDSPELDELSAASQTAKHVGTKPPVVQEFRPSDALDTYPELIQAAEGPVIDTSCAALLQLARKVHACGQKVVLTGEGADEWLVGYPWYKAAKLMNSLDFIPGLRISDFARRAFLKANKVPHFSKEWRAAVEGSIGGPNAWIDSYGLLAISKLRFYGEQMGSLTTSADQWGELGFPLERAKKWHPLNRGIWMAGRVTLAGHLLQAKGDRVAMHNSVEVRYPFLDEEFFNYTSRLHPDLKLRGLKDKYILRKLAERWVPMSIAKRNKVIFRAPLDSFHIDPEPHYVKQLLSEDSLRKTGYFDPMEVHHWRKAYRTLRPGSLPRLSVELGLAAVVATQLWHHTFISGDLAAIPQWKPAETPGEPVSASLPETVR